MGHANQRTGDYPIETVEAEEIERLRRQSEAWAADARWLLERIGIRPGWRCLDLGCGPEGLTRDLSARVGPEGEVVGLEYSPDFVKLARAAAAANVSIVEGDAYATGLPAGSFDFVHFRFLASTAGRPELLVAEAKRVLRPGGILAAQEADARSLMCHPPHPAWDRLRAALEVCFPEGFGDDPLAYRLYRLMRGAGFEELGFRPALLGTTASHPWQGYFIDTALSLREVFLRRGLFAPDEFDATLADCRAHLAHPDTLVTSVTLTQTWGRTPAGARRRRRTGSPCRATNAGPPAGRPGGPT